MTSLRRLDELRVDARYRRERRDLYRAKIEAETARLQTSAE